MKRLFILLTAMTMLSSFSMMIMAEETGSKSKENIETRLCNECDGGNLYSQKKVGGWSTDSILRCNHGFTNGLDQNAYRNVYTYLKCDNCNYSNIEWNGFENCSWCYGYGKWFSNKKVREASISKSNAIFPAPDADVLEQGKVLLAEHNVKGNETIHFAYKDVFYQSHGAKAINSLADAKSQYPDCIIPEKLGNYEFLDFTLYPERTAILFPDMIPMSPKDLAVQTDKTASQYFLCYGDGSNRFRIEVMPLTEEVFTLKDVQKFTKSLPSLPAQANLKCEPEQENNTSVLRSFWVLPEANGKHAFFIQKMEETDCLESNTVSITDKEALYIYNALQKDFH